MSPVRSQSFKAVEVIFVFVLAENHRENILTRTISSLVNTIIFECSYVTFDCMKLLYRSLYLPKPNIFDFRNCLSWNKETCFNGALLLLELQSYNMYIYRFLQD